MSQQQPGLYFTHIAAAYGTDAYGCGQYDSNESCSTTTQDGTLLPPLTGFLQQPTYVVTPVLLLIAVTLGTISYIVTRKIKAHRRSR